jgi:hypothetical protein
LLANEKITELQAETSGLRDARKILETVAGKSGGRDIENAVKKIEQQLQISDHLLKDMKVEGSGHDFPNDEELAKEASRLLSLLEELKAPDGWTPAAVMRMIAESKRNAEDSEARVRTLQGSLLNVQQRLTALGKGTERPACWANPDTGRPEYVFNVSLTANSVRIQDNALLSSQRDLVALPLAGVHFERPLGFNDFRDETRSLFQWSEKQGCRFFVRVVDETAAHEKAGYKLALRVVQERFYTFEGVNPSINEARQGRSIESSHAVSTHAPQVVSDAKTVVRAYECSRQMPRKTSPHAKRANLGRNHGALRSIRRGNADSGPGGCPVQTAPRGITGSPKTGE